MYMLYESRLHKLNQNSKQCVQDSVMKTFLKRNCQEFCGIFFFWLGILIILVSRLILGS